MYAYNLGFRKIKPFEYLDKEQNIGMIVTTMLNKTNQMFKINGLPDTIPQREILRILQTSGKCVITEVDGKLYAFECSLGGEPDVYFLPTHCIWASPYLKQSFDKKIGEECVLIRNDTNAIGLLPILTKYATYLVEAEITLLKYLKNTRAMGVGTAKDNKMAESLKAFFKALEEGKDEVVVDKMLGLDADGVKMQPLNASLHTNTITQIIEAIQYLFGHIHMAVGLNSAFNMKREAINSSESIMNDDLLLPSVDNMLYNINLGFEEVNKMYGTNISMEIDSAWYNNQQMEDGSNIQEEANTDKPEETKGGEE